MTNQDNGSDPHTDGLPSANLSREDLIAALLKEEYSPLPPLSSAYRKASLIRMQSGDNADAASLASLAQASEAFWVTWHLRALLEHLAPSMMEED